MRACRLGVALGTCVLLALNSMHQTIAAAINMRTPPNTSWATLPVGYYGAQPSRPEVNIDMLSKMRIVALMQEDGPAWETCCPHWRDQALGRCDNKIVNATSTYPDCNASLDQHMYQDSVFRRVKEHAAAAGRPLPHCMLYLNAALLFPFDRDAADRNLFFRDIFGAPHVEAADPAILTYFWGFGSPKTQAAWVDVIRRSVHADGVYADNFDGCAGNTHTNCSGINMGVRRDYFNPFGMFYNCSTATNTCLYLRANHNLLGAANKPSVVLLPEARKYVNGLHATLRAAAAFVKPGIFTAKTVDATMHFNRPYGAPYGANTAFGGAVDIGKILSNGFKYVIVSGTGYQSPLHNPSDVRSSCTDSDIARFMLYMEKGAFLICNGWDPSFSRPLGLPLDPSGGIPDSGNGGSVRRFEHGAEAHCGKHCYTVWPGYPPPPPPPPPPPEPPLAPKPANYIGCFHDHTNHSVCDLPCIPVGSSGGCTNACPLKNVTGTCSVRHGSKFTCPRPWRLMTLSVCNEMCGEIAANFFGVQAGHACFCGFEGAGYGSQGKAAADSLCDTRCVGNKSEICGGSDLNSVFHVTACFTR